MTEVKMVTFTALKRISLILLVHSYYRIITDLLFDNNIDKNPFANLEISESDQGGLNRLCLLLFKPPWSDIEEANASLKLFGKDEEEDAFVCVD